MVNRELKERSKALTEPEIFLDNPKLAREVYDEMVSVKSERGYGFLKTRPFEDDPLDVFQLDRPFIPAVGFNQATFNHVGKLFDRHLIEAGSRQNLIRVMEYLLLQHLSHLDNGGNVAIVTNHMSYVDLWLLLHSLAAAELRIRGVVNTDKHSVIAGRTVGTFGMEGLKPDDSVGWLYEDGLLPFGNVMQTFPPDQTQLSPELIRLVNLRFMEKYMEQLVIGGQIIFLAASGIEDTLEDDRIVMHPVISGATHLLTEPNRVRRIKQKDDSILIVEGPGITTQLLFLDLWLKKKAQGQPVKASVGLVKPYVALKQRHVQAGMDSLAKVGNEARLEGTPQIFYQSPPRRKLALVATKNS